MIPFDPSSGSTGETADPRVVQGARVFRSAVSFPRPWWSPSIICDASKRRYFTPDEDEGILLRYSQYLGMRAALLPSLHALELACSREAGGWETRLPAFTVALAIAGLLVRDAREIAGLALSHPVLARKLDESSPRHGIPRKTLTHILRAATDPFRLLELRRAVSFYERYRSEIERWAEDPVIGDCVLWLRDLDPHEHRRRRILVRGRLDYEWFAFRRRHRSAWKQSLFRLFEWSGRAISDLRQPGVKPSGAPKRIDPELRRRLISAARPGDIFITRHDDALSNLFLPGFWPHAALFLGSPDEASPGFLEARKDGVLRRPAAETLGVDAAVILRPPLETAAIRQALERALKHEGKLYDFAFDFRHAERLACTEVVYRGYHGLGSVRFRLIEKAGRWCLPAEDLMDQAMAQGFRVVAAAGLGSTGFASGLRAELLVHSSRTAL